MNIQAAATASKTSPDQNGEFKESSEMLLNCIIKSLSENKAEDITTIDLRGRTSIGDYMVVASGRSTRQVSSISQKLVDILKTELGRISKVEGLSLIHISEPTRQEAISYAVFCFIFG